MAEGTEQSKENVIDRLVRLAMRNKIKESLEISKTFYIYRGLMLIFVALFLICINQLSTIFYIITEKKSTLIVSLIYGTAAILILGIWQNWKINKIEKKVLEALK